MSDTKTPEQQTDDYRLAVHELGHHEACASFRIPSSPKLFEQAERCPDADGKIIGAVCIVDRLAQKIPFQRSVIGWSGYIVEHLCGVAHKSNRNPFPLQPETLRDFYSAAMVDFEENFSRRDQIWICASPDTWRSFKSAHTRLLPKVDKIKRMAEIIAADFSDTDRAASTNAALRDFFQSHDGATHADFIRLVCGGDAERFERFIISRVALHLTSNRTTQIEDAKLSMGTPFAAEFERGLNFMRDIYAGDFKDETAWLKTAREFQQWAAT